jgi:hypothetical protein
VKNRVQAMKTTLFDFTTEEENKVFNGMPTVLYAYKKGHCFLLHRLLRTPYLFTVLRFYIDGFLLNATYFVTLPTQENLEPYLQFHC